MRKGSEFTKFIIVDSDGSVCDITYGYFEQVEIFQKDSLQYRILRQFVANELKSSESVHKGMPKHIEYMKQHQLLDYCDESEKGHFKWYPKGLLIQRLMIDYAAKLALDWGAFEMKNPIIIRGDNNLIGQLMGEFHERDYKVDGGREICYLRYASDPLVFPFMQKVSFSHRQSPLKVYEETSCFRNEQQGEVGGLKRVRNFTMTDMHAACVSIEEARKEFEHLCVLFADLMNNIIAKDRWVLGWEGTIDFFEQNKEWLINIVKKLGVPSFFKLMSQMSHYYTIKNEYQAITGDGSNIQVSTVQWDIKDGERFDIGYTDDQGHKQPCPVIVHASSFGSIERALCAILENIAIDSGEGVTPMFPFWLSPVHARVLPISENHLPYSVQLAKEISSQNIRVDIDDRIETLGKKIRDGEMEWIPYLIVIGDKEIESGNLAVRSRFPKQQIDLTVDDFVSMVLKRLENMPFRDILMPKEMSRRPIFSL